MIAPEKDELIEKRLDELCDDIEKWVTIANQDGMTDSPDRHFHIRTMDRLRDIGLAGVFKDALFFDYLYATLISWGMNRGKKENRLCGFEGFMNSICSYREEIIKLSSQSLAALNSADSGLVNDVAGNLWELLTDISSSLSARESKLVLGTKTLHHLLPDLVPPIDNVFTLGFFPYSGGSERIFKQVFIDYLYVYENEHALIEKLIRTNPLNSCITKTIDNAIIGYHKSKGKD